MRVAFDVDGTLLDADDHAYKDVVEFLKSFAKAGAEIVVWSGGGKEYAETWSRRLGIEEYVAFCASKLEANLLDVDIAVDDQYCQLGKVNLEIVKQEGKLLCKVHPKVKK